ncbi:hypothetical protein [uncultured Tateyamaria sp.]|uniref:hypothetical protein n=1 Tax=uncultured Tateyamaria sp. TaxID=455651 RepID=UPI0026124C41|nr:hypothetical protein [uncultured Tateyamaria sp.]
MKRILWLAIAATVAAVLFYVSRFWDFRLWSRDGLFGIEALRPQGGLVGQWVRGTDLAPFELLIWAVGVFLVLTLLQKLYDLLNPPPE